ncbi:hypothetical protein [Pseudoalteromonas xiamenensis]
MYNEFKFNSNIKKVISNSRAELVDVYPRDLLSLNRLDVIVKYIYYKALQNGCMNSFIRTLYLDHIRCINGFVEADDGKKVGSLAFLNCFNELASSVAKNGFNPEFCLVISDDFNILDGAHRLSTLLDENKKMQALMVYEKGIYFDYDFFLARGMSKSQLDFIMFEFIKLDQTARIAILWPQGHGKEKQVESLIAKECASLFLCSLRLT